MIILPVTLESYRSLKDKSVKLQFETGELTPENLVGIASSIQKFGYLAFKEDKFRTAEINVLEDLESDYEDKSKTPSKRLRNVLYRAWEQDPKGYKDFNLYYDFQMEKLIEHFKSKLE